MIFEEVEAFVKANSPLKGEFLGIDLGAKKTGFAVSCGGGKMAVPSLMVYEQNQEILAQKTLEILKEKECKFVVLGFPFGWEEGSSAMRIKRFAKLLSSLHIPVLLYDENASSLKVKSTVYEETGKMTKKQKNTYDAKVASFILLNALEEINRFK